MNDNNPDMQKRDPDMVSAEVAMERAAIKAREVAKNTGTAVIIFKNGIIQEERTDQTRPLSS